MLPHKDIRSSLQKVTISPKFIDVEKVEPNEKAEELLSIERARENPWVGWGGGWGADNETGIICLPDKNLRKMLTELGKRI